MLHAYNKNYIQKRSAILKSQTWWKGSQPHKLYQMGQKRITHEEVSTGIIALLCWNGSNKEIIEISSLKIKGRMTECDRSFRHHFGSALWGRRRKSILIEE